MISNEQKAKDADHVKIVEDATCTFCGCVCDDIELHVQGDTRLSRRNGPVCWAPAWFLNHEIEDRPSCLIEGQPAAVEEGIERAAQILADARYPLIYGLSDTTSESQRVAVGDRRLDRRQRRHDDQRLSRSVGHGLSGRGRSHLLAG